MVEALDGVARNSPLPCAPNRASKKRPACRAFKEGHGRGFAPARAEGRSFWLLTAQQRAKYSRVLVCSLLLSDICWTRQSGTNAN